jgi:hypothetical protein
VKRWMVSTGALVVALACLPTEPCACPPEVTFAVIYGDSPGAGTPDAWRWLRVDLHRYETCADSANFGHSSEHVISESGQFRVQLVSGFPPGVHCATATFFEELGAGGDSLSVVPFTVTTFGRNQALVDSTELALPPLAVASPRGDNQRRLGVSQLPPS